MLQWKEWMDVVLVMVVFSWLGWSDHSTLPIGTGGVETAGYQP